MQAALGNGIMLDADVFHHHDQNVIDYVVDAPGAIQVAENIHTLNFTGAEVSLRWPAAHRQRFELSYTGIHGSEAPLPGLVYRYVFNYPVNEGVATWWSRIPGGSIRASAWKPCSGIRPQTLRYRVPIRWWSGPWDASFSISNRTCN